MFHTLQHVRIAAIRAAVPTQEIRLEDEAAYYGGSMKKVSRMKMTLGMDKRDCLVVALVVLVMLVVGVLQERGHGIRQNLARRSLAAQFAAGYALILSIVILGAYGVGYAPVDPIYAQF